LRDPSSCNATRGAAPFAGTLCAIARARPSLRFDPLVVPFRCLRCGRHARPVVVTATREPESIGRSSADIVVIDSATIRNTTADSVEDLLRRAAGMQVVRNGGPGRARAFSSAARARAAPSCSIDGVRVGSATLGQAEFEALSLAQIERIEVLRGPASSLYGADAVGGVVQIFTRRGAGAPRGYGGAEIGGYDSARGDVGASGTSGLGSRASR
jgi:vitamin B12 transporter